MIILSSVVLVGYHTLTVIDDNTDDTQMNQTILTKGITAYRAYNYGIPFLLIGLGLASISFSLMLRSHPIYLFIGMIFMFSGIFVAIQISNAFQTLQSQTVLATAVAEYDLVIWVMEHLPHIVMIFGGIMFIAMLGKIVSGRGGDV